MVSVGNRKACKLDEGGFRCWGESPGTASDWYGMPDNPLQVSSWVGQTCVRSATEVACFGGANPPTVFDNPEWVSAGYRSACVIADDGLSCWDSFG